MKNAVGVAKRNATQELVQKALQEKAQEDQALFPEYL